MAFVAGHGARFGVAAEIRLHVLGPHIGFGQQKPIGVKAIELGAYRFQDRVGFRQIFVRRTFAFDQIRHGIEPQAVHAEIEPKAHHGEHRF
jgi:hypothetical protein